MKKDFYIKSCINNCFSSFYLFFLPQKKLYILIIGSLILIVSVQAQVLNLLKDLQAEFNLTYLFISHDMAVVKHVTDRMMVMNKGEIEEIGYPEEIYKNPSKPYPQRLINAIPKGVLAKTES